MITAFLTIKDVAAILKCSKKTVGRMIERRELSVTRVNKRVVRIPQKSFTTLLDKRTRSSVVAGC